MESLPRETASVSIITPVIIYNVSLFIKDFGNLSCTPVSICKVQPVEFGNARLGITRITGSFSELGNVWCYVQQAACITMRAAGTSVLSE